MALEKMRIIVQVLVNKNHCKDSKSKCLLGHNIFGEDEVYFISSQFVGCF